MQKVFIYGSCVTRDGVEWWPDYGFELNGYVARQSLISSQSIATKAEAKIDFESIDSSFQKRMALGDLQGNLVSEIIKHDAQLIVWDLCDERNGVHRFASGNFLTHNMIYRKVGLKSERFSFGSDTHYDLWASGLEKFLPQVAGRRIVVNATPWAVRNDINEPVNSDDSTASAFNHSSQRYFDLIASKGIEIIEVDQLDAVALSAHKWGEAPFHYVEATYHAFLKQLKALVG